MTSSAPQPTNPSQQQQPQQRSNRRERREGGEDAQQSQQQNGASEQYYGKQNSGRTPRENPPHKKNWQQKRGSYQEGSTSSFEEGQGRSRRGQRGQEDQAQYSEANGAPHSPSADQRGELRERRGGKRRNDSNANGNHANGTAPNGTNANGNAGAPSQNYPAHLESRVEEMKRVNALIAPAHKQEVSAMERELMNELTFMFPNIPPEGI
jgi:hypothetical protein